MDASVAVDVLTGNLVPEPWLAAADWLCPSHVDVEVLSALRGLERSGAVDADRATQALTDLADWPLTRYDADAKGLQTAWALRGRVTAYDALCLALAEQLGVDFVTRDARLARAGSVEAIIV